jgi:hypothetical protein
MRNTIISILVLLTLSNTVQAIDNSFENIIPDETFRELLLNEELSSYFFGADELSLAPNLPLKDVIAENISDLEPTITVEVLFLFRNTNYDFSTYENHVNIFNSIRAISTLQGIEYYSASRGYMRTFFNDACIIDSPESNIRQPDPVVNTIPDYDKQIIYTKDSSFGKNHSDVTYLYYSDYFAMLMENRTAVTKFILTLIDPGEMKTYMLIVPKDNYILFYGVSLVKTINPFGAAEDKGKNSLYNRLVAFYNWFKSNFSEDS